MRKLKVAQRSGSDILLMAINVAGHPDQCTEALLRKTGMDLYRLQIDLGYMQTLIDKELTRRYNEQTEKGNVK
jgi:hypothetical protein